MTFPKPLPLFISLALNRNRQERHVHHLLCTQRYKPRLSQKYRYEALKRTHHFLLFSYLAEIKQHSIKRKTLPSWLILISGIGKITFEGTYLGQGNAHGKAGGWIVQTPLQYVWPAQVGVWGSTSLHCWACLWQWPKGLQEVKLKATIASCHLITLKSPSTVSNSCPSKVVWKSLVQRS